MKQRLVTAIVVGAIAAGVGVGIAIRMDIRDSMLGISIATGVIGFLLGLAFKITSV